MAKAGACRKGINYVPAGLVVSRTQGRFRMMSSGRLLAVGAAVLGAGVLLWVTRLAYVWQSGRQFWNWAGMSGVIVSVAGLIILLVGWVVPKEKMPVRQIQVGGDRSTNFQASGDINFPGSDRTAK
jgi:hypothetical protein